MTEIHPHLRHLAREILSHQLQLWDRLREFERAVGRDLDDAQNSIEFFCTGVNGADEAYTLPDLEIDDFIRELLREEET